MAQKAQGLAGVDAKGVGGRLGMARALGSPDLGTEIEKQDGWVGTALGPPPACSRPLLLPLLLCEVILALELRILAVQDTRELLAGPIPAASPEEALVSGSRDGGMWPVAHPSWAPGPFEGRRPAEVAGQAGRHYGHDSAQAEVNKQHPALRPQEWRRLALRVSGSAV